MKQKLLSQYNQLCQWIAEGRIVQEKNYQLVPIEALSDKDCKPAAINLYYQNDSANEPCINMDFEDIVSEAWSAVNQ